ncbi:xanthine dehydrogenase family protein molybdopterin-binding subunit [Hyphomicrobium sp. DMF-1]|uniref:xanthine dehydrogenase family protein molybdopterin-binding subunit n=1 Tax=Hyphomicrobium sp. DMF-1 TaxID=3019544 RepID=UPI0022EBA9DD|nr:xanthine dehydrogenase family protein molybdopterin-binding subunit [Hyphomicrobium sp. DMF-1]WBT36221.1 xanthine dehydrogenase family protein molybdopterin-binding subunit [Hyphomicrobium sp. DMF-1]
MYGRMDLSQFRADTALALDRRNFVRLALGSGAGLVIGAWLPAGSARAEAAAQGSESGGVFMPFVKITPDNVVTVLVKHQDKGQGVATGLSTLVAEELDADWAQVKPEFAPANVELYKNLFFGVQGTGGSTAIANSFEQYRKAGAAARAMLVEAAAKRWGVDAASVKVAKGVVSSGANSATFGELAKDAASMAVPADPKLKTADEFVYIGKSFPRLDSVQKTTGARIYTQDVQLPGMLVATLARSPRFGGTVQSVDDKAARAVKGVVDVVQTPHGVAVLATSTYAAIKGRDQLAVSWDESKADMRGTDALVAEYKALADKPGLVARNEGDATAALAKADKVIEADYIFPFLAHAPMEPMNCVMQFKDGRATLWTGSQLQTVDQNVTAAILGIKPEDVVINTLWAGGSFGRRGVYNSDYIAETAGIVKATGRSEPIKLVWTREDDIKGGYYRPLYVHRVKVGLGKDGEILGWHHRIVGQSIAIGTPFEAAIVKDGVDGTSVEGVADTPYAIPNMHVEVHNTKAGPPPLWWRSVGHTHTAYVMETMIDEIAALQKKDPVAFRLSLLEKHPRHAAVLKLAAEKAGWDKPAADGVFRGVAVHESFKSFVAEVAEIRIVDSKPKVERVVAAVDCGLAINPDNIKAQVEGGIGFGLGAVLHSKVTLKDGVVDQANFDGYEVLRFNEMPKVEVHILPSAAPPTGIGEPGVPPIGPAVANAVAAGTGQRVRVLPFADGLKLG